MKRLGLLTLALVTATSVFAQKGVEDGSRYGHGEDSINTIKNISIYSEFVKTNNFKDAYEQGWKTVFEEAPLATLNIYTHGVKILRALYKEETDAAKKTQYSEELMKVYEQRIKYLDQLNSFSKNKSTEAEIMISYAHDYVTYNNKISTDKAYELLRKAVDMNKGQTTYYVLDDLMKISSQRYLKDKNNDAYRDALLQDYVDCAGYIDEFIAAQEEGQTKEQSIKVKDNIDGYFVKSGAADCETLQNIYGPKVEENKDNLEYLNKIVLLMTKLDCRSSDAYFSAAEYAHAISPSAKTAKSLGSLYIKQRDDMNKALEFYNQAIELDDDKSSIANTYYTMATLYMSKENYDKSRSCLQKAISNNPNYGDAYILMAQLYAINHKWSNESALDRCAYFAVIDKLEQAKRVDSSVAERANELISQYKKQTPQPEDLFMFGYKAGDNIEIKGWINETTTIR